MGKLVLVTGGARSGKSDFAEGLFDLSADVCYLATNALAQDQEMLQRILLHQEKRSAAWETHEGYTALADFIQKNQRYSAFLLDCATMLTTNYFYYLMKARFGTNYHLIDQKIAKFTEAEKLEIETEIMTEWQQIIEAIKESHAQTTIVTNEVGLGIVPENSFARWFRDIYGRVNQFLGKEADEVYLVVAGIPMKMK